MYKCEPLKVNKVYVPAKKKRQRRETVLKTIYFPSFSEVEVIKTRGYIIKSSANYNVSR